MVGYPTVRNFVKAATFTATLTCRHLRTEPARLPLLGLRLLPGPARQGARSALGRTGALARAYALWDAGRRAEALDTVRGAAHGASNRRVARFAAFALAVEQPGPAEELIARLPEGRIRAGLAHRLALTTGRAVREDPPGQWHPLTVAPRGRTLHHDTMNDQESTDTGLRILHLVTNALPHTNAGYTQRTHRIALGQRAAGLEPHVATRAGYPLSKGVFDTRSNVEVDGIRYHRLLPWLAPADHAAELRAGLRLALPLAERLRPDVLHAASNHGNAELALELGRRLGAPVVYEVRGFLEESWLSRDPSRSTEDAYYRAERARETACMHAADLVVTLGETMRAEITGRGVDPAKVTVVPNAVDESFLEPLPDGGGLRRELGIGADDFVVGTTTSCYSYEGLDTLVDAVAELRRRGVAAHALIVGDGPELGALRERAAAAGLEGAAHFPGRVPADEVRRHHAALDVFCVPRRDERVSRLVTPLKPVEAMAGGLPVVAGDLDALREIVEPGTTGEVVPPECPGELADCLEKLAADPETRSDYGRAARERVGRHRTWEAAAHRYIESYRDLRGGW
ncbi:glycosyltransferase family 4 protein [Streptomonospora litoralis]|uniref:GDP-mannose-dependent alpha-(1-6)-phosphatidylinositol monomannoside mannosyltransferase n=1 Tax=Streptomonospora litoralis TaxID=2498135 RepID=A0A4P6Q193_9ACTN|nr:glycosyltransferase family 4 protein [Streptomonospora litoralis]QBI52474.1 GDP-mannose-dependent alpha-(1-6)-phosphatidylinositol monomannoside mannosyltransferase [Streptomonospora litoralis]